MKLNLSVSVKRVKVVSGYVLELTLSNGMKVQRDFTNFVKREAKGVLKPLADLKFFAKARASGGTLEWPGELDFCPDVVIWGMGKKWFSAISPPKSVMY